jgi:hypothetical protein
MQKPSAIRDEHDARTVGHVFGTPLKVVGSTWLPLTELGVWGIMAWVAGKRRPERSFWQRAGIGSLTMSVLLGSEWCHNLAHAAAARIIKKPMDAIRITWGMPILVYYDVNDQRVSPREHMIRAAGGPFINFVILLLSLILRPFTRFESVSRDITDVAIGMNSFLLFAGLQPQPWLDGGPLVKWSLVERGYSIKQADEVVRKINTVIGPGLIGASVLAFKKRRKLVGVLLGLLSLTSILAALGFKDS